MDAKTLAQACQVSRAWARMADDELIWQRMCVQHIGKICEKCGWGLPRLQPKDRRLYANGNGEKWETTEGERGEEGDDNGSSGSNGGFGGVSGEDALGSLNGSSGTGVDICEKDLSKDINKKLLDCSKREIQQSYENGNEGESSSGGEEQSGQYDNKNKTNSDTRRKWKREYARRQAVVKNWRKLQYEIIEAQQIESEVVCVQGNETYMASACTDNTIRINDVKTGDHVQTLVGHTDAITSLYLDDCKLVSGSLDGTIKIWCYRRAECIRTIAMEEGVGVTALTMLNTVCAAGKVDGTISVYDFSNATRYDLAGHAGAVNALLFLHDHSLVSCSDDMLIKRWHIHSLRCTHIYNGHSLSVRCIATSATSQLLYSASLDGTIRVWDADSAKCLEVLCYQGEGVWSIATDSFRLISGHNDGSVCVWNLDCHKLNHRIKVCDSPVNSLCLSETRFLCGCKSAKALVFDFTPPPAVFF
ncbi:F-box/WD repeat-containing protein pof1 [Zancudomyces culisetae]|uniref:F-box/WD repeat-containing protein pof1 n=1 Tax=Zancudomyces culisetae TaxID=1213189 RepID=A0A1R1PP70_ZANCU|nr:F-box/WD repeat-containing protein pof1 [Zancudomyces culisetae]OMH82900.1 F-box/WD repeat-containing protein pof1 [Zancudomyces culisetae]|eukprot:OMH82754.1 F-box/WD repeat-containing protein pof1 [Zancudomyces culisetae]